MTPRLDIAPSPVPLENFATHFDQLFSRRNQRESFRRYLEGLLLGQERNKTLTALANAEPVVGALYASVQTLQWFLSESCWQASAINAIRKKLLLENLQTAPTPQGALVIDETGDRKDGKKTAHVGRQYLGSVGKVDNGVVSVTSLYADERLYYPLEVEPYTPAHWFDKGNKDAAFRTKPQIALELVEREVATGMRFKAVVADSFYGENDTFVSGLAQREGGPVGFVLALPRSHCWWHREGEVGSLLEAAQQGGWQSMEQAGSWEQVVRTFTDGHTEKWWALEVKVGPYGQGKRFRAVVASTDPALLPEASTWFLVTNLALADADLSEVVRLYGLRTWVEQSYKQVKQALGWAQYQVRSDVAIRRHWTLVMCAFSFVLQSVVAPNDAIVANEIPLLEESETLVEPEPVGGKKKEYLLKVASMRLSNLLAGGPALGSFLVGALALAGSHLEGMERSRAS
jgi:SRSO17 transposase